MPGDPRQCRMFAARCVALSMRAWRPDVRQAFLELAETWTQLAAETESDQALYQTICEMNCEPYDALLRALHLRVG